MDVFRNLAKMITYLILFQLGIHHVSSQQLNLTLGRESPQCGDNVILRCGFSGTYNPTSNRVWSKDSRLIMNKGNSTDARFTEDVTTTSSGYFTLTINMFTSFDDGTYECLYAFNSTTLPVTCSVVTEEDDGLTDGEIAGIVIGVIAAVGALVAVVIVFKYKVTHCPGSSKQTGKGTVNAESHVLQESGDQPPKDGNTTKPA